MKAECLTRKRPRAMITERDLRIATWTVLSLYRGKALHNLTNETVGRSGGGPQDP